MSMQDQISPAGAARLSGSPSRLFDVISSLGARITDWIRATANDYAAAAAYKQLSKLSNTELQRRGLSRANLARDVWEAYDTTAVGGP